MPDSVKRRMSDWSTATVEPARPARAPSPGSSSTSSSRALTAAMICLAIVLIAMASAPECAHWFIIPVFACGFICCYDGLLLFFDRGHSIFHPVPLVGAFGVYFFFLGPILHVATDYWFTSDPWSPKQFPEDWRPWLGLMAILNLAGLGIYKLSYKHFIRLFSKRRSVTFPQLDARAVRSYGLILLAIVFVLQVGVYAYFGGVGGFIQTFSNRGSHQGETEFAGLGWLFALAESFPILLVIICIALFKRHLRGIGSLRMAAYIAVVFLLTIFFGGLRGSRGNTVYTLVYIIGLIHLMVRPLQAKMLVGIAIVAMAFMYVYAFYKANPELLADPATFFESMASSDARGVLEAKNHRNLEVVLMGDLERSDLQADLLYRMLQPGYDVDLAYGRTYLDGAVSFVPYQVFRFRPPGKLEYGTDAVFGLGAYQPGRRVSLKIYGLAGETMLNFGPLSAPFGFILLAAAVGWVRALNLRLTTPSDARWYFVPILSVACIVFVSSDIDNVIFLLVQHALMPLVLVKVCSRRVSRWKLASV